jgi:hypothetical protein
MITFLEYFEQKVKEAQEKNVPLDVKKIEKNYNKYKKSVETRNKDLFKKQKPNHYLTKTEAYYTEEEMIKGYKAPRRWELSEEELLIYNNL